MKAKLLFVINFLVIGCILAWYGVLLAQKIDLTTADLGRHLQNGSLILHGSATEIHGVLHTNFYSYTMPEQPFVNHHWLSGVVFYLVYLLAGFNGLSIFYILMGAATLGLFFYAAIKKSNLFVASVITLSLMPLLASRVEVRPEVLTYFLTGVFYVITRNFTDRDTEPHGSFRWLWLLPLAMLLWVNLHIGFVFGFLVIGAFWLEELIRVLSSRNPSAPMLAMRSPDRSIGAAEDIRDPVNRLRPGFRLGGRNDKLKRLTITGILCVVAALINPNFIKGFLYPLNIFKNYGYLIVENQSIKFLEGIGFTTNQHFLAFKIVAVVTLASFIVSLIKNWRKFNFVLFLLVASTMVLAYNGIRHFPSFAFFVLVALAENVGILMQRFFGLEAVGLRMTPRGRVAGGGYGQSDRIDHSGYKQAGGLHYTALAIIVPVGIFVALISVYQSYQTVMARGILQGVGLLPGEEASAEFLKANKISGPIFNNYDVGGYLIFNTDDNGGGKQRDTEKYEDKLPLAPSFEKRGDFQTVFVDNRPEGYTNDFFQKVYIPAQEDGQKWAELDKQYNFNVIFFSYRDYTPWAQAFLIARVQDQNWVPVYVDSYNIIFVKRNEQNKDIITKFEIDRGRFGIKR